MIRCPYCKSVVPEAGMDPEAARQIIQGAVEAGVDQTMAARADVRVLRTALRAILRTPGLLSSSRQWDSRQVSVIAMAQAALGPEPYDPTSDGQ
jgi:hypothetical protein